VGFKWAEGKGLREGLSRKGNQDAKTADSRELWKSVEKSKMSYSKRQSKASVARIVPGVAEG